MRLSAHASEPTEANEDYGCPHCDRRPYIAHSLFRGNVWAGMVYECLCGAVVSRRDTLSVEFTQDELEFLA